MQKWNRKHQGLKIDPMNKNQIITAYTYSLISNHAMSKAKMEDEQ